MPNDTSTSVFETVCSLPPVGVNYVTSPDTRGTCDILFSCIFTLVICTWNIQHLSVPYQRQKHKQSRFEDFKEWLRICLQKTKWMIIAMIAPEYMLGLAFNDHVAANKSCRDMKELAQSRGFEWTEVHAYYANMGGMTLNFLVRAPYTSDKPRRKTGTDPEIPFRPNATGSKFELQDLQRAKMRDQEAFYANCPHPYPYNFGCPNCKPTKSDCRLSNPRNIVRAHTWSSDLSTLSRPKPLILKPEDSSFQVFNPPNTGSEETLPLSDNEALLRYLGGSQWQQLAVGLGLYDMLDKECSLSIPGSCSTTSALPEDDEGDLDYPVWQASWALNAAQVRLALKMGILTTLPRLTRSEIEDKSKSDTFVKATAIIQVSWLAIQVTARSIVGLATSQLEISVLSFAVLTFITYILIWNKPQDVRTSSKLNSPDSSVPLPLLSRSQIAHLATEGPWWITDGPGTFWLSGINIPAITSTSFFFDATLFPEFFSRFDTQCTAYHVGFGTGGILFGALHCIAWHFSYPSIIERTLWRVAAVYCAVYPLTSTMFVIGYWPTFYKRARQSTKTMRESKVVNLITWGSFGIPYIVFRVIIMVESLRGLAYLPVDAFKTVQWTRGWPHAG